VGFKKVGERALMTNGFLTMLERSFEADGVVYQRTVVTHPGAVVIVPMIGVTKVVMVKQFRSSIEAHLLELPAGKRDVVGEDILVTADRELQEECGLKATRLVPLGSFLNSPGFTDEETHVVLALGLSVVESAPQSLEEAEMQVRTFDIGGVDDFSALASLTDAKSIVGLLMAKTYLAQHPADATSYPDAPEVRERVG